MMMLHRRKLRKIADKSDALDVLPDDLVLSIIAKLTASASSPADLINVLITCKRLNRLGMHPSVLSQAGPKALSVTAKNWSASAQRFLLHCVAAGSTEASYTLGMIRFYCLQSRDSGLSLMAKAAMKSHAPALYSLAVIQFNGSGAASKNEKNLQAGVALAHRAAFLGHVHALRELGHCLQDGFGVRQNVAEGRRLLIQANARELASVIRSAEPQLKSHFLIHYLRSACQAPAEYALLSDFGCNLPAPEVPSVNRFLKEWFESGRGVMGEGLRLCSHEGCGRPETRHHEFRRCSVCGKVNYCSRGCQALDWKLRHKVECVPMVRWVDPENGGGGGGQYVGGLEEEEEVQL